MNSEGICEIALRYFFAIKQIGRNTLSDKLDRPAYLQLLMRAYLKEPNTHICFVWNSVVKDFFTTDAISPKRPSGGWNVNIRTNTGG
jgi:hypothetical protein